MVSLLPFGMGLAVISIVSLVLRYVIALKSPPNRRAAWTVGVSYVVTVLFFMFGDLGDLTFFVPLICIPAALIVNWYWRWDFRRDHIF